MHLHKNVHMQPFLPLPSTEWTSLPGFQCYSHDKFLTFTVNRVDIAALFSVTAPA